MNRYELIYRELDNLLPGGVEKFCSDSEKHVKLKAKGFMDLSIDVISWKEEKGKETFRIAMAHNFIQNGDVMADPDMEIRIHREQKTAEALTFQLDSLGVYQVVYPQPEIVNTKLKIQLNIYLVRWLKNIKIQGFKKIK